MLGLTPSRQAAKLGTVVQMTLGRAEPGVPSPQRNYRGWQNGGPGQPLSQLRQPFPGVGALAGEKS